MFFFKEDNYWGVVDFYGIERIFCEFKGYSKIDEGYIKLSSEKGNKVFSFYCNWVIILGWYYDYYFFFFCYLIVKDNWCLGFINWCG